jgi:hypothetical protein
MVVISLVRSRRFSPVKAPYPDVTPSLDGSFGSSVPSDPSDPSLSFPSSPIVPRILTPAVDLIGPPPLPPKPPNLQGKYLGEGGTLKSFRDLIAPTTPMFARFNPAFGALQPCGYGCVAAVASPFVNRYRV